MTTSLVTSMQRFSTSGVSYQVEAGTSCSVALAAAGTILSGVNILLGSLIDEADEQSCQLFAIRTLTMQVEALIDSVEALIDSVEAPIRAAEDPAPQNPTSPVRGAEVPS